MKGRALQLLGRRELAVNTVDVPDPHPGFVRCRVLTAGVCGTDLHLWKGRDDLLLPHVLGHDFCAAVDALGDGVDGVPIGQRITANPSNYCGRCTACWRGLSNLCQSGRVMGMQEPGCFQDYIFLRADRLVSVADTVSNVAASVLEPVAVALHVLDRVKPIVPAGKAVTVGAGPIGLATGRLLSATGYEWVAVEPLESRRALAQAWGARAAFAPADDEALSELLGDDPAVIVVCVAGPSIAEWTTQVAPPGSAIAVVGNSPSGYPGSPVMLKELSVVGIRGGTRYDDAVRIAAQGIVDLEGLNIEVHPLEDAPAVFDQLEAASDSAMRVALTLEED